MTEDEAKERWCPFARDERGNRAAFGADGTETPEERDQYAAEMAGLYPCIGSACMAWRFKVKEHRRETELWSRSKNEPVNSAWGDDAWWRPVGEDADKEPPAPVGYCGLAGKPS